MTLSSVFSPSSRPNRDVGAPKIIAAFQESTRIRDSSYRTVLNELTALNYHEMIIRTSPRTPRAIIQNTLDLENSFIVNLREYNFLKRRKKKREKKAVFRPRFLLFRRDQRSSRIMKNRHAMEAGSKYRTD